MKTGKELNIKFTVLEGGYDAIAMIHNQLPNRSVVYG